ncbi:MAG: cupredoxin domain-containing protein [Nitrososphaerales archaeon]
MKRSTTVHWWTSKIIRAEIEANKGNTAAQVDDQPDFVIWVIFSGLLFAGFDLLYGISTDLRSPLKTFDFYFVPLVLAFVILCFVAAGLTLVKNWVGYLLSAVVSLGFVLPSLLVFLPTLSNPVNFSTFAIAISSVPILILVAFFSILCLLNRKKGIERKKYLESPRSWTGVLTSLLLILIIAGIILGASTAKIGGAGFIQISIVQGASNPSTVHYFSPDNITVVLGVNSTVIFTNNDYSVHTVNDRGGVFASGLMNSGDTYSFTFQKPGTYTYHCIIHPFMVGTIVVKPSS